jgi:DNA-binding IclR family transcriptional regulator
VLLAFTENLHEDRSLQSPLEVFTRQTITNVKDLRFELDRVRSEGWASTLGELEEGFNGVAVPVSDALGRCRASLSVSGPVYRMPPARLPEIAVLCKKAAGEISASLGKTRSPD